MKFKITITDNETNEVLVDDEASVIVGAYGEKLEAVGVFLTKAKGKEILATCATAIEGLLKLYEENFEMGRFIFAHTCQMVLKGEIGTIQKLLKAD